MIDYIETAPDHIPSPPAVAPPAASTLPADGLSSPKKLVAKPGKPRRAMTSGD